MAVKLGVEVQNKGVSSSPKKTNVLQNTKLRIIPIDILHVELFGKFTSDVR